MKYIKISLFVKRIIKFDKKLKKYTIFDVIYFLTYEYMKLQNKKGFTLIELLVVITIIGILATGATTVYTSQIQKARDTTRINDIKALQTAVEQVYQDTGEYPKPTKFDSRTAVSAATYLPRLPKDPKNGQTCNNKWKTWSALAACVYSYATWPDANNINYGVYVLSTGFESLWKVEADGTRDAWAHNWRWEVGNGIMRLAAVNDWSLNIPANDPDSACASMTSGMTATGVLNSSCTIGTAVTDPGSGSDALVTIHGS